ncbi:cysteine--tRNA ligase [Nocardioides sp. NPDC057577]|uniref:cysteine--tRNA ligase n=1 Tax=Nocardioides sp. NPDC057577 TaxID=3346171 RepID=UPI0036734823
MALRLYDSATREVRDFTPLQPGKASLYVCGLTVQSEPHVGHVRSGVNFDVLQRWLRASGYETTFIRNVTDIDDKILAKSADQGRPWYNLAYDMHRELDAAYASLNVARPTYEPLATGHIPEIIALIEELIAKGHAYAAEDGSADVYFDVRSWPSYGELSGQKVDDMEAAADADPRGKRDPRDFALWKGRKVSEPETASWPSPWGLGRPGWHIECSAMAGKYLGPAFDFHGGGLDLRFPHHENEQAQSRAAGRPFASYWLHNAWITTSGEKMSKSLGNSLVIPEVLKKVRGIELRYYLVAAHYRSHVEFSFAALDEAALAFQRIEGFLERVEAGLQLNDLLKIKSVDVDTEDDDLTAAAAWDAFASAMDDDLGTPAAVAVIHNTVRRANRFLGDLQSERAKELAGEVRRMLDVLGLDPADPAWGPTSGDDEKLTGALDVLVRGVLDERAEARAAKDWARADAMRDRLKDAGIEIEDTPEGPKWSVN